MLYVYIYIYTSLSLSLSIHMYIYIYIYVYSGSSSLGPAQRGTIWLNGPRRDRLETYHSSSFTIIAIAIL